MVYTGTHDNNTTVGWWDSDANESEKRWASEYLGNADDGIHWAFIRAAFASVAILAVIPVQDVLGLNWRRPHEYSQQAGRQLVVASPQGCVDAGVGARSWRSSPRSPTGTTCVKVPPSSEDPRYKAMGAEFAA